MYTHGLHDHCELPLNAQRLHVTNSVQPGTPHGDAWDDLIDEQEARGRIIELPAPLIAGTVLNPMGCIDKVKIALDGSEKVKFRPFIDGRSTREGRRNLGDWCDPRNRQYSNQTTHETIARFIVDDAAVANVFDYKGFYLTMPRALQTVARNAMYWQRRGAGSPTVMYSLDEWFGQVPTPSKVELHAHLLQLLQEKALSTAAGHPVYMSRRTDDTVLTLRNDEAERAQLFADIFLRVCADVNQPIQPTKVLVGATIFKFDGYLFNLAAFPNNRLGVHPGGVGIDAARSADIHQRLRACLKGTDRKVVERLVGVLEWVAILTPHIRALIYAIRSAMLATKTDTATVVIDSEARADLQRLLHHFPPRHAPDMVPFYKLYRLAAHDIDIFTDASGNDAFGGYMTGLFYTEQLTDSQILRKELTTTPVAEELEEELSLCTAYLELVALFYMVATAGKRLFNKIIRWTTDAQASAKAWTRQASKHHATNRLLAIIGHHCTLHAIIIDARWVPREENQLADILTHADIYQYCRRQRVSPREQVSVPRRAVARVAKIQRK